MVDFWGYLQAVASQGWQFYGGVIAVLSGLFETFRGQRFKWTGVPVVLVGLVLFVWANFAAWDSEHNQRLALEAPNPYFVGNITTTGNVNTPEFPQPKEVLVVGVTIENRGGASRATNWIASAQDRFGTRVQGLVVPPPVFPMVFRGHEIGMPISMTYSQSTSMVAKTQEHAVHTYDGIEGILLVVFHGPVATASLRIGFEDRTSKWYTLQY
jgi:hypothetical protein